MNVGRIYSMANARSWSKKICTNLLEWYFPLGNDEESNEKKQIIIYFDYILSVYNFFWEKKPKKKTCTYTIKTGNDD